MALLNDIDTNQSKEGSVTRMVERQTARVPSLIFLNLAVASMVASLGVITFARRKEMANFIGLWAPSFLLLGVYNKLVKIEHETIGEHKTIHAA